QLYLELTEQFVESLNNVCIPFGMKLEYPEMIQLQNDRPETYMGVLKNKVQRNTDLAVCMLPNNRKDRYDALKKYLCLDVPVPSQMVLSKTVAKRGQLMSVATKIGIQINAKLGGEIWSVTIPSKTMIIIGLDTYKDSKQRNSRVSAFVASTNPTCTRFYSRIIYENTPEQLFNGIVECMHVTNQNWFDFYLISQCARQGTVAPTHYNVVWNSTNLKAEHFQRLTFKLCHLYYNWPGTIRIPAVCQYAFKLAFLVSQSLHEDFDYSLADKLFYL
ncbi:unnamed protein product, partial [Didymodactylos carnosus]